MEVGPGCGRGKCGGRAGPGARGGAAVGGEGARGVKGVQVRARRSGLATVRPRLPGAPALPAGARFSGQRPALGFHPVPGGRPRAGSWALGPPVAGPWLFRQRTEPPAPGPGQRGARRAAGMPPGARGRPPALPRPGRDRLRCGFARASALWPPWPPCPLRLLSPRVPAHWTQTRGLWQGWRGLGRAGGAPE